MRNRTSILAALSAAVLVTLVAATGQAWNDPGDMQYLMFNRTVAVPGATLTPGTYVFERADRNVLNLVRVLSKDRKHVYLTAFTHITPRPAGLGADTPVTFGEAERGMPLPISAWFPPSERHGFTFIYER